MFAVVVAHFPADKIAIVVSTVSAAVAVAVNAVVIVVIEHEFSFVVVAVVYVVVSVDDTEVKINIKIRLSTPPPKKIVRTCSEKMSILSISLQNIPSLSRSFNLASKFYASISKYWGL